MWRTLLPAWARLRNKSMKTKALQLKQLTITKSSELSLKILYSLFLHSPFETYREPKLSFNIVLLNNLFIALEIIDERNITN